MKTLKMIDVTKNEDGTYTIGLSPAHCVLIGMAMAIAQRSGNDSALDAVNSLGVLAQPVSEDGDDDGYTAAVMNCIHRAVTTPSEAWLAFNTGRSFSDDYPSVTIAQAVAEFEKDEDGFSLAALIPKQ